MNQVATTKPRPFSVAIASTGYRDLIQRTLNDTTRANRFVAAISSAVATNPALQECEAGSILSSALLGEALNLSPSPQLGQYYLVPYKKKNRDGTVASVVAQFQMGYKGYIQLAIRSGQYKKLNVLAIKEGELLHFDAMNEDIEVELIDDEEAREQAVTIGYYAMFEYLNGFKKAMYWSKTKMEAHADKYSQAFSMASYRELQAGKIPQKEMWKYSSFWYKNFDDMAIKTLIRNLISKWGVMSIDMQKAMEKDMGEISPDGSANYIDNAPQGAGFDIDMPKAKQTSSDQDGEPKSESTDAPVKQESQQEQGPSDDSPSITPAQAKKLHTHATAKEMSIQDLFAAAGCTYKDDSSITVGQHDAVAQWAMEN